MKIDTRLRKIRVIKKAQSNSTEAIGITLPLNLIHWVETYVTVTESGNTIILESGTLPTSYKKTKLREMSEKGCVISI